jgi:hypothetical protein
MTFAATASSLPIAIGLVVALVAFAAWAVLVAGQWALSGPEHTGDAAFSTATPSAVRADAIHAVVGPSFQVPAPDDAAVAAAMASRVPPSPHLRLVVDHDHAAPDEVQRSA